jgi:hypothetical protein
MTNAGLDEFINLLDRMLPEALPKRYGLYEPPQNVLSETGIEHFLSFLQEHLDQVVVWYPHRPVTNVSIYCTSRWGATRHGFRTNYVRVGVEARALEQPGWNTALNDFWIAASQTIRPFYGDARTLKGFIRRGATYGSDMETDFHPVKGPWWSGIPNAFGHAVVLGDPYLALWPRFKDVAQVTNDLAFISTDDWTTQEEASRMVGGIPDSLAQRWIPKWVESSYGGMTINWNTDYPMVWPFEDVDAS